ncbi:MAG: polysaccharide deacetylase family protein [Clostridia bacterium]|nr:polysaccharide deacetylase family protein [Clostridia bacterium]
MKIKGIPAVLSALILTAALVLPSSAEGALYEISTNEKVVALTFDDGPHPVYTEQILDTLSEYSVKATFFIIGENAKAFPEMVKKELELGHEVENHTLSHCYLSKLSTCDIEKQLEESERIFREIGGESFRFLRPPGGLFDKRVSAIAEERGYLSTVLWSLDTKDWAHNPSRNIISYVIKNCGPGDIILMHDYISGRSPTLPALKSFIPKLKELGYEFVTISELFGMRNNG